MREFKFRAVVIDDEGGSDLRYGVWPCGDRVFVESGGFWMDYESIMQYTGLKDKNGKEIYEGDIVHCSIEGDNVGNVDVIEFKNGSFWLRYRDRSIPSWIEFGNEIEVIGNIYEHSELIQSTAQTW